MPSQPTCGSLDMRGIFPALSGSFFSDVCSRLSVYHHLLYSFVCHDMNTTYEVSRHSTYCIVGRWYCSGGEEIVLLGLVWWLLVDLESFGAQ